MSRTDVHAPWWVKERDPLWRDHFVEHHDHSTSVCDLAAYLAAGNTWTSTTCYITWTPRRRNIGCGCRMCTGQHGRKLGRRQQRTAWRAMSRDAVKTSPADRDGLDIAPPGRFTAW
jgi:hypothetical protein